MSLAKCELLEKAYQFYCGRRFWISLNITLFLLPPLVFVVAGTCMHSGLMYSSWLETMLSPGSAYRAVAYLRSDTARALGSKREIQLFHRLL